MIAEFVIKRALLPWLLVASVVALSGAGAAGMYAGYEIANARHAQTILDLKNAHIDALQARTDQYLEAVRRSDQVSGDFFAALKGLRVVNTTITQEVRKEVEKLVYTDCRLPDTGADLLKKRVDAANMKLLDRQEVKP